MAERWARREEVMVEVVLVRVCRVLGAGLERYIVNSALMQGEVRRERGAFTCRVAAVGPFFSPFMTTFQISSNGGSSSHGMDINGESHLTIDEGSSNRIRRLSNLSSVQARSYRHGADLRGRLVRAFAPLFVPFTTLFRGCDDVYLPLAQLLALFHA
jgi:hypothetical protein